MLQSSSGAQCAVNTLTDIYGTVAMATYKPNTCGKPLRLLILVSLLVLGAQGSDFK